MSEIVKPIVLDETGVRIAQAIENISQAIALGLTVVDGKICTSFDEEEEE